MLLRRYPKSGLPDFGTFNVQVGYSRLGCRRPSRLAALAPQADGTSVERYCAAACLLGPDLVAWPGSSGITKVLLRFGTSPTAMTLTTFIATVSTTDTERTSELEMNSSLPSGVNVTQLAPADNGAARPAMVSPGRSTLPISARSASEYSYTALLGMLVTHSVLLSGATPMPCDGSLSR